MNNITKPIKTIIDNLQERAKELNCLYKIEELLSNPETSLESILHEIVDVIPQGWQYTDVCQVRIVLEDMKAESPHFEETPWMQSADIMIQDKVSGKIEVCYTEKVPFEKGSPFLKEENKQTHSEWDSLKQKLDTTEKDKWKIILDVLNSTDRNLYKSISRKMLNYLCWKGIKDAELFLQNIGLSYKNEKDEAESDPNRPLQKDFFHARI